MWRYVIAALAQALEGREHGHILLDGMPGSGKSVALAALAHWARLKGWVVRSHVHACRAMHASRLCDVSVWAGRKMASCCNATARLAKCPLWHQTLCHQWTP